MLYDNKEKLIAYQKELEKSKQLQKDLELLRSETQKISQARNSLSLIRKNQLLQESLNLEEAIRKKDFLAVSQHSKNITKIEKEIKKYKKVVSASNKINSLFQTNSELNLKINNKIEAMALREAKAVNFVSQKIAQARNKIDDLQLSKMKNAYKEEKYKLDEKVDNYKNLYGKNIPSKGTRTGRDLEKNQNEAKTNEKNIIDTTETNKKNILDKKYVKDYYVTNNGGVTLYTHRTKDLQVRDNGYRLTVSGSQSVEEEVKAMLDVAKAKGWDLSKVRAHGSSSFKREVKRQLKFEIERQKGKAAEKEIKKTDSFSKLDSMKKNEQNDMKNLKKEKSAENQYSISS
jgi:hypothetical protein